MSKFYRLTDEEYERIRAQGEAARKRGRLAKDCPYNGGSPKCRRQARAWFAGWTAENGDAFAEGASQ